MKDNFLLMAGPCAIEGEEMAMRIADKIVKITQKLDIPYIFKGSDEQKEENTRRMHEEEQWGRNGSLRGCLLHPLLTPPTCTPYLHPRAWPRIET